MKHTHRIHKPSHRTIATVIAVVAGMFAGFVTLAGTDDAGANPAATSPAPVSVGEPTRPPAPTAPTGNDEAPAQPSPEPARDAATTAIAAPAAVFPTERALGVDGEGNKFSAADPALVRDGDVWRLFTTETFWSNVPTWESDDLVTWTKTPDAMPTLPSWAAQERDLTWAPDVVELNGRWVLFFSSRYAGTDLHCIGHGVADTAIGPYETFDEPIVCELDEGGSIDPMVFVDENDDPWLLWKVDANAIGRRSELRSQPLSADGTTLLGEPSTLLTIELAWEDPLIEQPELVQIDGVLHLFYAANWYNQPAYQVGHATCESVAGPCTRTTWDRGWLTTRDRVKGPGAVSVEVVDGQVISVYHGWIDGVATEGEFRSLIVEPITFAADRPVHTGSAA